MFKKKKKDIDKKIFFYVFEYYKQLRTQNYSHIQSINLLKKKKYPEWIIKYINERGEKDMVKKYEEEEFEEEEEEEFEEEEKPRKPMDKKPLSPGQPKVESKPEITKEQIQNVLMNFEQRLNNIESWIFRVKAQ